MELGLPLVFSYERYWWLSGPSHLKRQQGPAAVAVAILSRCLMCIETGICPLKSLVQIGKLLEGLLHPFQKSNGILDGLLTSC